MSGPTPRELAELARVVAALKDADARAARFSEWVPHKPHAKQLQFLSLEEMEGLYGGAAGGGKSDALLADMLSDADESDFSALILRRTFQDLSLPGALMDRSHAWLDGTRAHWQGDKKRWTFPEGAVLQFGYCDTEADLQRYKSAEFQAIYIDELTEWSEAWYTFLFSRLRRRAGSKVRLRMRAGTNPDGPGQGWVRERWGIPEHIHVTAPIRSAAGRVFLPARAEDNPSLDLPAYELSLEKMTGGRGGVKWRQLREGLWIPDGAGLVYLYTAGLNRAPALRWRDERARWHFILGVDYGFTNACGFAVIGWREGDPTVYVLEAFTRTELDTSAAAAVVRELEATYAFDKMVGDVGGLGKVYVEEGRRRHQLPIEAAKKENKRGYQVLFNDSLGRGGVKLVEATTADLRDEWSKLPWDKLRKAEATGFPNHAADATLYAWRECPNYHEREPKPLDPAEALAAHERALEDAAEEEARREAEGEWWEK